MGAVLRSTVLLEPLRRKYPNCHITWVTLPMCRPLLELNPLIDRVITLEPKTQAVLEHLRFDLLCAVDKSLEAGALAERIQAKVKRGFGLTPAGQIRPLSPEADYQFAVGLDDELKFRVNDKPETQQITETMGLEWRRDPYVLELSASEREEVSRRRREILQGQRYIIGYNTGCSLLFSFKRLTVERSIELIGRWRQEFPEAAIALLGGPEDTERQAAMKAAFAHDSLVVNTPTRDGLRSGILWMDAADVVFTGCSLGEHISLGLKKPTIAWFGVSCIQEIDVYDRGVKLQSPVACSPCWKKTCVSEPKCFDALPLEDITRATRRMVETFVKAGG
jgi:ADP-heptose:LPS heptosyltransferase